MSVTLSCTTSQRSPGYFTFLSLGARMRDNLEVSYLLKFKFCSLCICLFLNALWILAKDPLQLHEQRPFFLLFLLQRYPFAERFFSFAIVQIKISGPLVLISFEFKQNCF